MANQSVPTEASELILPSLSQLNPQERLAAIPGFEDAAGQVAKGIHQVVLRGGPLRGLADLLHGTWLGHPLHVMLTDVTLGAWLFGSLMDGLSLGGRSRAARRAADSLIAIGTLSAVPTALAGITDYSTIPSEAAATGAAHGLLNALALGLYAVSLWSRRSGHRGTALLFSGMGVALIMVTGWLGGELSFRYKVGVNRQKDPPDVQHWTAVMDADDLAEQKPRIVKIETQPILLYRYQGHIYAMGAVCTHAEGPLEQGKFEGCQVQCPWHDSVFDLASGRVVHGPALYPEPSYEARTHQGKVEIRLA
jgi:nitrite reductase/ring-hydroxylating ferredoxin subunit/uncharacterized membrane protein